MDTVFILINKNGEKLYLGADHFGYEDLYLKAVNILINPNPSKDDLTFIKKHLYNIDINKAKSPDIIIDQLKENVVLCLGFIIKEFKDLDVNDVMHVSFRNVNLMINPNPMTYDEFRLLYQFFLSVKQYDEVVINNKYFYHIDKLA